jgi:hypothetical protein
MIALVILRWNHSLELAWPRARRVDGCKVSSCTQRVDGCKASLNKFVISGYPFYKWGLNQWNVVTWKGTDRKGRLVFPPLGDGKGRWGESPPPAAAGAKILGETYIKSGCALHGSIENLVQRNESWRKGRAMRYEQICSDSHCSPYSPPFSTSTVGQLSWVRSAWCWRVCVALCRPGARESSPEKHRFPSLSFEMPSDLFLFFFALMSSQMDNESMIVGKLCKYFKKLQMFTWYEGW